MKPMCASAALIPETPSTEIFENLHPYESIYHEWASK